MVFTQSITVFNNYAVMGGGWGSMWAAPENLLMDTCEIGDLFGCGVRKHRLNSRFLYYYFCRGLVHMCGRLFYVCCLTQGMCRSKVAGVRGIQY